MYHVAIGQGGGTGVLVQNIEGTLNSRTTVPTPNIPELVFGESRSTGQTVCVANNTDVYLITGTTLNTTLTSGVAIGNQQVARGERAGTVALP